MSKWRYQPVYEIEGDGEKVFSLCEVHFDDANTLTAWTEAYHDPRGNDSEDLRGEITRMLVDAWAWVPVEYSKLEPGMVFERAVSLKERKDIAEFIDLVFDKSVPA